MGPQVEKLKSVSRFAVLLTVSVFSTMGLAACSTSAPSCDAYTPVELEIPYEQLGPRERLMTVRMIARDVMYDYGHNGRIVYNHGSTQMLITIKSDFRDLTEAEIDDYRLATQCAIPVDNVEVVVEVVEGPAEWAVPGNAAASAITAPAVARS